MSAFTPNTLPAQVWDLREPGGICNGFLPILSILACNYLSGPELLNCLPTPTSLTPTGAVLLDGFTSFTATGPVHSSMPYGLGLEQHTDRDAELQSLGKIFASQKQKATWDEDSRRLATYRFNNLYGPLPPLSPESDVAASIVDILGASSAGKRFCVRWRKGGCSDKSSSADVILCHSLTSENEGLADRCLSNGAPPTLEHLMVCLEVSRGYRLRRN